MASYKLITAISMMLIGAAPPSDAHMATIMNTHRSVECKCVKAKVQLIVWMSWLQPSCAVIVINKHYGVHV